MDRTGIILILALFVISAVRIILLEMRMNVKDKQIKAINEILRVQTESIKIVRDSIKSLSDIAEIAYRR